MEAECLDTWHSLVLGVFIGSGFTIVGMCAAVYFAARAGLQAIADRAGHG